MGLGLYRDAFDRPEARVGLQREKIGNTLLWVFPNPSGLNAHFQVPDYARLFRRLVSRPEETLAFAGDTQSGRALNGVIPGPRYHDRT